ncbi:asparagine synthase (glutamine-hydrolyzing) [Blastochloris viridis]|uniref:asparagine synthase (glutamine-hydrolyzing) n=1 Tax=Blastochloris viridis TaxID=1079 RepID=A0A0H5B765_BLAVI|nr:asparagine synthase (glutamine-hydrolyzing) [Blastochloris viridis]ALK08703.1 Asparagine synthetase [glutamine-hydrolyzing] 1 [Blastochloris viridis]BAR98002.1 asparagine synthetase [glutamine-hydrolyzing] [Blastochloris viridis]CUU41366.1 Asparagine synthetase [glutamine-hydrolyzing] 1 [Blastochloris viridis]
MCGFAGFHGHPDTAAPPAVLLGSMIRTIAHRGPDALGLHVGDSVGLAHARLSIIDLAGGAQPMADGDGELWVSFNGEIFNYVELRAELIARGHRFRTASDTEVILEAYRAFGPACVARFNGDFSFALWDGRQRRLLLARDRAGVRPLFYATRGGCLYFGSEIKSLLAVPGMTAAIDPIALDQTLTFWFPLAPRTIFKDISELPPGHILLAEGERVRVEPYWRLSFPDAHDPGGLDRRDPRDIADELRALLFDATRIRLRADVPVGAYLSGGLDSSIITAIMKRLAPDRLRTYSLAFEDAEFDERVFQLAMAEALGTDHHTVLATEADIARCFPDIVAHVEQPLVRTGPAPLFLLAKFVRAQGLKVVLTGEGADEVFAGYDIFKEAKLRRFCAAQPGSKRRLLLLQRLYPYLPRLKTQSQSYREAFFVGGSDDLADPLFSLLPRTRMTQGAKAFYTAELRDRLAGYDALADLRERLPADFPRWHPLSQAQYLEMAFLLPGYILSSQSDRVAMAHAVESRFPFLDPRLIDFAGRLPPQLKLRVLREKHILREATRDLVPAMIADRPKQPYRAPEGRAFVGPAAPPYVTDMLAPATLAKVGLFAPAAVDKLVRKCTGGRLVSARDNLALTAILSTQLLAQRFVRRTSASAEPPQAA